MRYEELSIAQLIRGGKDLAEDGTVLPIVVVKGTNATTAQNVFGAGGAPFPTRTLVAVFVISLDTTAGNIVLKHGANTVATIAKGTTSGALVGAASLANTTVTKGQVVTVESSSAGNASVIMLYS